MTQAEDMPHTHAIYFLKRKTVCAVHTEGIFRDDIR